MGDRASQPRQEHVAFSRDGNKNLNVANADARSLRSAGFTRAAGTGPKTERGDSTWESRQD